MTPSPFLPTRSAGRAAAPASRPGFRPGALDLRALPARAEAFSLPS